MDMITSATAAAAPEPNSGSAEEDGSKRIERMLFLIDIEDLMSAADRGPMGAH